MSAWDIDEEENLEGSGGAGRVGAEYYSIIVHYPGAKLKQMMPHHVRRDNEGRAIKSSYKKTENQTEEGTPETVLTEKVEKWSTKKDVLDAMTSESRQACNAIKAFMLKSMAMMWYHNGNQDECSQFGVVHWHIVLQSEIGANGRYKYIHDVSLYRTMKAKVKASQGYVRTQAVRSIIGIMRHFNCKPRLYLGCNTRALYLQWKEASNLGPASGSVEEFLDPLDADDEAERKTEKRYSSWDDDAPANKKGGWECDEDSFIVPASSRVATVVKETPNDANCRLVKMLMMRYRANNMSEMFHAIGNLAPGEEEAYKQLWHRLSGRPSIAKTMEVALNHLKCENQLKTFDFLVDELCKSPDIYPEDKYEDPIASYKFFIKWCKHQRIDVGEFVTNLMDVLNKKDPKVNTFALIGPSNAGKTVMITKPLQTIMRYVGQIGNRGNDSPFMFQECVNCSLITIDECIMAPEHYEDMKLLMGGETMKVNVKHQGHATINRTPVLLTGNKEPWVLDYSAKDAMCNRMHLYKVQTDEDLKEVKYMHPGMWWYIKQQYDQLVKVKPLSRLEPYPSTIPMDETAIADPLE